MVISQKINANVCFDMLCCRLKHAYVTFIACFTCALFVFSSEHSHSTVFGANSQYVCPSNECSLDDTVSSSAGGGDGTSAGRNDLTIHVVITFTNAEYQRDLQSKFAMTVSSLFQHSSRAVTLYVIGDAASQLLAKNILAERIPEPDKYKVRAERLCSFIDRHWLRYRLDGTVALELQYRLDDFCGGNRNYTSAFDRCRSYRDLLQFSFNGISL